MISIVIVLVLVLSVALNMFMFMRSRGKSGGSVYSSTIMNKIQNKKQLKTVEQTFESVLVCSDDYKVWDISVIGTSKVFVAVFSGKIECACDLARASLETLDENKVKVTIPHSRVTDCSADMRSVKEVFKDAGWFTSHDPGALAPAIQKKLDEVSAKVGPALMEQADKNTAEFIKETFEIVGIEAEILFDNSAASSSEG